MFEEELNRITDEEIRNLTKECLANAPPHFWYRSASSTGKYHAKDENEIGGLVLHTKRDCMVAEFLIESWPNPIKPDVIRSACILHDIGRYDVGPIPSKWSRSNHPQIGSRFIESIAGDKYDKEKVTLIAGAVATHMGKWGSIPIFSHESLIVHLADVLATNIYVEVDKNAK